MRTSGSSSEEWRPIEGFPGYIVSNTGRVKSVDRRREKYRGTRFVPGVELRMQDIRGYKYVQLCKESKHYPRKVHRLVAEAFLPNPDLKPCVNHIDCNPANNRAENLEWVTPKENAQWAKACGHTVSKSKKPLMATNLKTGEVIYFESSVEAEERGFSRSAIWRNMKGEYSHHHGYRFEFA